DVLREDRAHGDGACVEQRHLVTGAAHARLEHPDVAAGVDEVARGGQREQTGRREVTVVRQPRRHRGGGLRDTIDESRVRRRRYWRTVDANAFAVAAQAWAGEGPHAKPAGGERGGGVRGRRALAF